MKLDMTKGNITKLILLFAFPLLLSNIFQQFYNIADTAIVGHLLGDDALSAVGTVSVIYGLVLSFCFGMTHGFALLISRSFGAGDMVMMKKSIAGTIKLAIMVSLLLTAVMLAVLKPVMRIIKTPEEVFETGYSYIVVIVCCLVVTTFYNMWSSILRAVGNTTAPLVFLIISSLSNVGLDILFIGGFKLGVSGAAYATVLAQVFSGILCFIYVIMFCPELKVTREDFKLEPELVKELLASGLAMSLMFVIVNVGTVILQTGINGLGTGTIAAHVAARKASEVFMTPVAILSQTISTFASQNYSAGKLDRVKKGLYNVFAIGFTWSVIVILIAYFGGGTLIKSITGSDNSDIIALGAKYLKINTPFYFFLVILGTLRSMLQGLGEKMLPIIASILEMAGKVIAVMVFVAPLGYTAICFTEPITWIICCVPVLYAFVRFFKRNKVGSVSEG